MQHLNYICLNFHCKILKIERVTVNLRRRLVKNQSVFVKGDVSRGNPGRIFFIDFSIVRSTWKSKN